MSLRRVAISSAGGAAVALWILFLVQRGVHSMASAHPLRDLQLPTMVSPPWSLFSAYGRTFSYVDKARRWLQRHGRAFEEHGPTTVVLLAVVVAMWRARGRL